eukprot:scpid79816/ scgid20976/ 
MAFVLLHLLVHVLPFVATIMAAPLPQATDYGQGEDALVAVLMSRPTRHFVRASRRDGTFHANSRCTERALFNFRPSHFNGELVHTIQNRHTHLYWSADGQDTLRASSEVSLDANEDAAAFFIIHTDANANLEFESVKYRGQYVAVLTTAHSHSRLVLKTKSQLRLNDPTVGFLYSHSRHVCAFDDHVNRSQQAAAQRSGHPVLSQDDSTQDELDWVRTALRQRQQAKTTVKSNHEIRTAVPPIAAIQTSPTASASLSPRAQVHVDNDAQQAWVQAALRQKAKITPKLPTAAAMVRTALASSNPSALTIVPKSAERHLAQEDVEQQAIEDGWIQAALRQAAKKKDAKNYVVTTTPPMQTTSQSVTIPETTTNVHTTQPVEDTGELTDEELFRLLGWF